jgi:hypothetical protein
MKRFLLSMVITGFMLFSTNLLAQQRPDTGIFPGGGSIIVTCHFAWGIGDWTEVAYTIPDSNTLVLLCNSQGGTAWVENRLR